MQHVCNGSGRYIRCPAHASYATSSIHYCDQALCTSCSRYDAAYRPLTCACVGPACKPRGVHSRCLDLRRQHIDDVYSSACALEGHSDAVVEGLTSQQRLCGAAFVNHKWQLQAVSSTEQGRAEVQYIK